MDGRQIVEREQGVRKLFDVPRDGGEARRTCARRPRGDETRQDAGQHPWK